MNIPSHSRARHQEGSAYLIALSRTPDDEERRIGTEALAELTRQWGDGQRGLTSYCHSLLNTAAFLYVD